MSQSRQLAAIMFTDIVGYTALMGSDDKKAFALLNKNRQLQKPIIESFGGQWIKEMGDGVIASFNTASNALAAAKKIQEACRAAADFQLRIGIHLGEVVFENEDIFGDGVNIASRIESLSIAGSVLMSKAIRDQVKNNTDFQLESLGHFDFKNVSEPMEVFALNNPGFAVPKREEMQGKLKLPQKKSSVLKWIAGIALMAIASFAIWFFMGQKKASGPSGDQSTAGSEIIVPLIPSSTVVESSIAVLPFINMSDDRDQEFFSDGISEEIINMLAQVPELKVIGRTSSFAFKGKNMDLKLIGEQLKVGYVLEGSVRKSGNKLRVTAQLIKVSDGFHLYSEKFDRELDDIFAIQDEVSLAILKAIKIKLFGAEKEAVLKKYTGNVQAYQLYLKGVYQYDNKYTPDGFTKAIEYFQAAIAIDSNYAIAYSGMAFCYMVLVGYNWSPEENLLPKAIQAANKALELDDQISESHLIVGRIKLHHEYKPKEAEIIYKKALAINPNSAEINVQLGFCAALLGRKEEALEYASKAESLDPFSLLNLMFTSVIYTTVGDVEKLLATGNRMLEMAPNFYGGHLWVGAAYALSNRYEEGIPELEMAVKLNPDLLNLSVLGMFYGHMGEKMKALEIIEKMKKIERADIAGNTFLGNVYGSIGEFDTAFEYYDKAFEYQDNNVLWVKTHFRFFNMDMKDPRVVRLLKKIGLADE